MSVDTPALPMRRYKMQLRQSEFIPDAPVKDKHLPAGAVLAVDEATALRWYERGVADIAPPDAETYGEIEQRNRRAEFFAKAQEAEGVFDRAITREMPADPSHTPIGPKPMPRRGRGDRGHPNMAGAGIVNADEDLE